MRQYSYHCKLNGLEGKTIVETPQPGVTRHIERTNARDMEIGQTRRVTAVAGSSRVMDTVCVVLHGHTQNVIDAAS